MNANDIWWRQLERELHRRGYWNVEVVAAGFPGASTQDELAWLRAGGLARLGSPDLVVLGYVTNDPDVRDANGTPMVKQIGRDIPLRQWRALDRSIGRVAPNLAGQLRQRLTAKWQASVRDAYPYDEWELKLLEPPNIDAYREVVGELGEFLRRTGRPFFVVTLPNCPSLDHFGPRFAPIGAIFRSAGLPFHDLLDAFVREYPPGGEVLQWGINPANGHPGTVSTRFYARQTADILERDYPSPAGREVAAPRRGVDPGSTIGCRPPRTCARSVTANGSLLTRLRATRCSRCRSASGMWCSPSTSRFQSNGCVLRERRWLVPRSSSPASIPLLG